jgi:Ca2+-binding RTX toxin-like protein
MTRFDLSLLRGGAELTPYAASSLVHIEMDEDSLALGPTTLKGKGRVDMDGQIHNMRFTIYGKFDYSSEQKLFSSKLTGINIASPTYGTYSFQDINLRVDDFLGDEITAAIKLFAGNDTIIGTNFADKLDGHKGNDTIYGGRGNDQIIGGTGTNQVWGQGGRDTFYVAKGSGHSVVRDFKKGEDKIAFLSGTSGLKLSSKGRDAYVYQNNDLMAIVNGASGQLNMNGTFLV